MTKIVLKRSGTDEPVVIDVRETDRTNADLLAVSIGDERSEVERVGDERIDAERTTVEQVEIERVGVGWLRLDGKIHRYYAIVDGEAVKLWCDGRTYDFEIVRQTARRAAGTTDASLTNHLSAPMPGTVLKINVGEGDRFDSHAPLIIMESMKMEMSISAPHAGSVKRICCKAGELVEMGAVLVEFDSADGDES
jgi:3-methylcrotonyl-CoA carboxylase alpha subunit